MSSRRVVSLLALVLITVLLLAPAAPASPARGASATTAHTAKACKRRTHETKKHWLKRCRCDSFKRAETVRGFRKRCSGARLPPPPVIPVYDSAPSLRR